jgi:hypothetical protein
VLGPIAFTAVAEVAKLADRRLGHGRQVPVASSP